jgi:hypothetical protein
VQQQEEKQGVSPAPRDASRSRSLSQEVEAPV